MNPIPISSTSRGRFEALAHSRQTPARPSAASPGAPDLFRPMKPNRLSRSLRKERGRVASPSAANLVMAREWYSTFQHDTTLPGSSRPAGAEEPSARNATSRCILIADDDAVVRGSLAAVLEAEGYAVDEARNGIEAVTRSINHAPDLILLDLNMPHWDGWTAFSQLDRVTPLLPVIVITARPHQYEKAVELGVDAFMEKPLNIPLLVSTIRRLTREDKRRRVRRITNPAFVTELLSSADS